MEKFKGVCKENENGICKPFECRKAICSIGEELRKSTASKACQADCKWTKEGINGINPCKDPYCPIGDIIVNFRKE